MKQDLVRLLKAPVYWLIICMGIAFRAAMAYMDYLNRGELFWNLAGRFWSNFGAVTLAFVILVVAIRLFSVDYEQKTAAVILSTAHGRKRLFWRRIAVTMLFAAISAALLATANLGVTCFIGTGHSIPADWLRSYIIATGIAALGGAGFSVVSGAVCDQIKSHGATLCICGLPYGISFFINSGMVKPPDVFWFLRYGFFTELMRGRLIASWPGFWAVWYCVLVTVVIVSAQKRRKERKEI